MYQHITFHELAGTGVSENYINMLEMLPDFSYRAQMTGSRRKNTAGWLSARKIK
jgi:hypothetical protein